MEGQRRAIQLRRIFNELEIGKLQTPTWTGISLCFLETFKIKTKLNAIVCFGTGSVSLHNCEDQMHYMIDPNCARTLALAHFCYNRVFSDRIGKNRKHPRERNGIPIALSYFCPDA